MRSRLSLRVLAVFVLFTLIIPLALIANEVYGDGDDDPYSIPEKADLKYPNLGSRLDQLVTGVEEGEMSAGEAAGEAPVHREESVAVTIYLSGNVDDVEQFLEDNGGDPRNVGEDYIEAYVPVALMGPVSEQPGVLRVREIIPMQPGYGDFTSQGVQAHLSEAWNYAGYSGLGIKVGIIDIGFEDFGSLMGTELPTTVVARCYTDIGVHTQNLADCGNDDPHGTAVAESVIDIAPEVSLYIAYPQSKGDAQAIVDWMVSEGVSVINTSIGWTFDGPGDGTSPFGYSPLKTVDQAVADGAMWVSLSHNHARTTWFAPPLDVDDDGLIDFSTPDETNELLLEAGQTIRVQLRWEGVWGQENTDLDMILYDSNLNPVWYSGDYQSGPLAGDFPIPWDYIQYEVPSDGVYHLVIHHYYGPAPGWIQMVGWGTGPFEYYTGNGSITNPAESANAGLLAVGAAPWFDVNTIEPYSSRGPAPDGRVKPDIVGADCGQTVSYPESGSRLGCWFSGTSQAAPHVAGLAAMVRQRFPDYTPAEVASYLKYHAQQRETPDPNNTWGHGFAQLPSPDREALEALYNVTGGANWTNNDGWLTNAPVGQWYGVTPDINNRVTRLYLSDNQLTGPIPTELGNLSNLQELGLWGNQLTGEIPAELGSLSNLQRLWLGENQLTGEIPAELGSLSNLQRLWLGENQLTGEIPAELGSLANLQELYLDDNELTGEVPTELGNLSNLQRLWLGENQLTGEIPAELGSLSNLQNLYLDDNELTGEAPTELGNLSNLQELGLWGNQLTGEIPAELGSLSNLQNLHLDDNELTGEIPAELGSLSNLQRLWLGENQLTGPIPTELGSLSNLQELYLDDNELTGEVPTELGSLADLQVLSLWGNQLTGEIPTELGSIANLQELWLGGNQLTGEVPTELGSLADLQVLSLWGNQLTGEIPTELGSLTNLQSLDLPSNQLTGEIPTELGSLANLQRLSLWGNQLTGEIPTELGSLTNLQSLDLPSNQLTGEIPTELGSLADLQVLSLWGNQLNGPIPTELGSLANLQRLSLWGNQLTGEIPTELGNLANLEQLGLSQNQLTGPIPTELGGLANLQKLSLWGNQLTGEIPTELGNLANLQELWLGGNQLTGPIPTELGSLANLQELYLDDNELTGEVPTELGSLANLEQLRLSQNQLTGPIPTELGGLANLQRLSLWGNQLTGEIPTELGNLANLQELWLGGNQLTGPIPTELGSLANLQELYLDDNELTGEVPTELGSLANLEQLRLHYNELSGVVPQTLAGLTMLEHFSFYNNLGLCAPIDDAFQTWLRGISILHGSSCAQADSPEDRAVLVKVHSTTDGVNWTNNANWLSGDLTRQWYGVTNDANGRVNGLFLGDNQLTGEIPPELGNLVNLQELDLADNQLTGEIPAELGRLTNLILLRLSGNQLTGCVPASWQDVPDNDIAQLGLLFCTSQDALLAEYDPDGDGTIERMDMRRAVGNFFGPSSTLSRADMRRLVGIYFSQ